jgi:hypothetical protein
MAGLPRLIAQRLAALKRKVDPLQPCRLRRCCANNLTVTASGGIPGAIGIMSASHYVTGSEVHAGDRVRYKGESGNIVFVSDGEGGEFLSGYVDYHGCDAGIMFCDDSGELTFVSELNENLELLRRKDQQAQFGG